MSIGAFALGAYAGPWVIRRWLDSWSRGVFAALLLFCLPLTAIGVLMIAGAGVYPSHVPRAAVWLSGACGVVLLASVLFIGCQVSARWWWLGRRDRGPVLGPAPSGQPSIAYPRSPVALAPAVVLAGSFAVLGFALATSALHHADVIGGCVFGILALWGLVLLVPFALGKVSAGGLYLTPDGVEHRAGLVTVAVPWDGLDLPRLYGGAPVDLTAPAPPSTLTLTRGPSVDRQVSTPWMIPVDPADRDGRDDWKLPTAFLPVTPTRLLREVTSYGLGDPATRQLIGSPTSLSWAPPAAD